MTEQRLTELASTVSDRQSVDWDSASREALGPGLEGLRTLDRLAAAFQGDVPGKPQQEPLFRWGDLEVLASIGEGRFGEVWKAWDGSLGREVALKLQAAGRETPRRSLEEARRLAKVRHENVLTVFGAAVHDGRAGIWSELLEGSTLEERLQREGPAGAGELLLVGTELCRALSSVHGAGMVHGDLKTSNVVREIGGRLVLVDFGSAHFPDDGAPAIIQATPSYLAPEVALGQSTPTPGSDLYALGALLYRLASAELWRGADSAPLRELRPDLPSTLVQTIESLLAAQPAERPRSAAQVERLLAPRQTRDTALSSRSPWTFTRTWLFTLAGLVVLALSLVFALPHAWAPDPAEGVVPIAERSSPGAAATDESWAQLFAFRGGAESPLDAGGRLFLRDQLSLRLELGASAHVYVLNEDQQGALFVLFPLPGVEPSNPLSPGRHRLPGSLDGRKQSWQVTSQGGWESFLIVESPGPLPRLEKLIARLNRASPDRGVELEGGPLEGETLRGVGGLTSAADVDAQTSSRLGQLEEELRAEQLRARLLVLENPR